MIWRAQSAIASFAMSIHEANPPHTPACLVGAATQPVGTTPYQGCIDHADQLTCATMVVKIPTLP